MAAGTVRSVDELLARARSRIVRLEPRTAWEAASAGAALVVDIRSDDDRQRVGVVPGSLHIPRTVLEWRVDRRRGGATPLSAGDVDGGFEAWRRDGLPVRPAPTRAAGVLPGMSGPD